MKIAMKYKHSSVFIYCLLVLLVVSCAREIPVQQVRIRRGLVYQKGADEPFSGFVTGISREGYRDQKCRFKKRYKDGVLNGRSEFYYPNGKLESIEPYENGELNGIVTRYYDSGQIRARIHFVEGMRGGDKGEMFWDENGKRILG